MSAASADSIAVEVIDDVAAFARLEPEWDALLRASEADGFFLTWDWLFSWWKHLAVGCTLQIIALRRDDELIALAPLALRHGSLRALPPVGVLQFLGSGVAGADHLDLIVRHGCEAEAVGVLSERLADSGRALALMRMRPGGTAAALLEQMILMGWRAWHGPRESCPFVSLRGRTFETYLASLGAEHRYAFRRKLKRLERRYATRFDLVRTEAEREEALATLFKLHDQRWRTRGDVGAFSTQALRDFHDDVSRRALSAGWLRLWVLRLDGQPVASVYAFLRGGTFSFYQAGFDPAFARDSVGMVMLGMAVRSAMEEGADELDLLHGTERYKAHWADAARPLSCVELHAPSTRGFVEQQTTALTRQARRATRVVLDIGRRAVAARASTEHAESR